MFLIKRTDTRKKIFCIGFNKTGTTSLTKALKIAGLKTAPQEPAEKLIYDWYIRDFKSIIGFCSKFAAFQDVPFSLPFLFIALDQAFPDSKFILTIRNTSEEWYNSITNFHSKIWGNNSIPKYSQLQNAKYCYKGFAWDYIHYTFETDETDPYNKEKMINCYLNHIQNVKYYFRSNYEKLLILNVAQKDSLEKLGRFIGYNYTDSDFPWLGKTNELF